MALILRYYITETVKIHVAAMQPLFRVLLTHSYLLGGPLQLLSRPLSLLPSPTSLWVRTHPILLHLVNLPESEHALTDDGRRLDALHAFANNFSLVITPI